MSSAYRDGQHGACPRCGSDLARIPRGGLDLDECGACGGAFLTPAEVERIGTDTALRDAVAAEIPHRPRFVEHGVRYLRCPRCSRAMNRKVFARVSGVVVDVCKEDGVFFDAGELAAILTFIDKGGLARKEALEARERDERAREARRPSTVPILLGGPATEVNEAAQLMEILIELFR